MEWLWASSPGLIGKMPMPLFLGNPSKQVTNRKISGKILAAIQKADG
jgi:hypothetical protein